MESQRGAIELTKQNMESYGGCGGSQGAGYQEFGDRAGPPLFPDKGEQPCVEREEEKADQKNTRKIREGDEILRKKTKHEKKEKGVVEFWTKMEDRMKTGTGELFLI